MWDKLIALFGGSIIKDAGNVVDKFVTTGSERAAAKAELSRIITGNLEKLASSQADVLKQEMKGNFLQKSWRPIVMLVFAIILLAKWFGLTADIPTVLELQLMSLLKIGIGGYVGARSLEKISETVTRNIDLTALRRKDRKDILKNQAQ